MREFDARCNELAKAQGRLFAESITRYYGSSLVFVKTFLNSSACENVDRCLEFNLDDIYHELDHYIILKKGFKKYNYDQMYWMGYIYRIWAYTYNEKSQSIYKIIQCNQLASLFEPYHTLDPQIAIDRILESKNIKPKLNAKELYYNMFFKNKLPSHKD